MQYISNIIVLTTSRDKFPLPIVRLLIQITIHTVVLVYELPDNNIIVHIVYAGGHLPNLHVRCVQRLSGDIGWMPSILPPADKRYNSLDILPIGKQIFGGM